MHYRFIARDMNQPPNIFGMATDTGKSSQLRLGQVPWYTSGFK
jgi:hypothetical protein